MPVSLLSRTGIGPSSVVRSLQGGAWGGVTRQTGEALRTTCGADAIVTGSVEAYELGGQFDEPEPLVAIALRMIDPVTGRILWADAGEREGWDRQTLFRAGRVHSRGELTRRMTDLMAGRLVRKRQRAANKTLEEKR